jgi:hypothetical protein
MQGVKQWVGLRRYIDHPTVLELYGRAVEQAVLHGHASAGMLAIWLRTDWTMAYVLELRLQDYGWIDFRWDPMKAQYPLLRHAEEPGWAPTVH